MRKKILPLVAGLCLILLLSGSSLGDSLLNGPPIIQLSPDGSASICPGDSTCLAIFAYDPDPQDSITVEMISGAGTYNPVTDTTPISDIHCFYPDTSGKYIFVFKVTDKAGLWDMDTTAITIDIDQPPVIIAPDTIKFNLCDTATVCFRITVIDPGDWLTFEVTYPGHIISCQGYPELCFHAYTDSTYNFTIIATDLCGMSDTAYTTAIVNFNDPPEITAPDTVKFSIGDTATVCFDVTLDDPNDTLDVEVNPPGQFNPLDSSICFFVDRDTTYDFEIIVTDSCGEKDTAYTAAVVTIENKPVVTAPDTVEYSLCDTATFCFDITISDPGGQVTDVWVNSPGVYNSQDTSICFYADRDTTYDFIIIVTDDQGLKDTAYTKAIVDLNDPPEITFPAELDTFLCEPKELCFMIEATDPDAGDTIILEKIEGPGDFVPDTGVSPLSDKLCFLPDDLDSTYRFIFRVTNHCDTFYQDTFYAVVDLNDPPEVTVPADSTISLSEPETLCFEIEVSDPENLADVEVNSPWYFDSEDTSICLYFTTQTTYCCTVIATDSCEEADTAVFCATAVFNDPPTLEVLSPPSGDTLSYLPTLSIHFNDDVGLNQGYYQIDSCTGDWIEFWSYNSNSSDTTIDWTVPSVTEGTHKIYFKVTDDGGLVNIDTCSYFWSFTLRIPLVSFVPDLLLTLCNKEYVLWIHFDEKVVDLDSAFFKIAYESKYITANTVSMGPALSPGPNFEVARTIYSDSIIICLGVKSGSFDGPGNVFGVYLTPGIQAVMTQFSFARCTLLDSEGHEIIHQTQGATIDNSCMVDVEEDEQADLIPSSYGLGQNYPNPYNLETQIGYQLPQADKVTLTIYNVRGQLVRTLINEQMSAGYHSVVWDGRADNGMQVSSGIYFYKIQAGKFTQTRKMVLLK